VKRAVRVAVIRANPAKSKHLASATCSILGKDVDFVNLRTETYDGTSRVPDATAFGTAAEDAARRDFTINSLFYNVHTDSIEDYTRAGLQHLLRDKLLETPLDASVTFADDPLRVLRAVRFGARYAAHGFTLSAGYAPR
jgi:tRNA nucleotidyltransferase (CCA-adding enzyme)